MASSGPTTPAAAGGELLLERERELTSIDTLLESAATGAGQLVLIEGRAGIGKSRLLAELRFRAGEEGMRVLAARGSALEREFPFGVVRQLFERALRGAASNGAGKLLDGAAASARPVFESIGADGDGEAADASFAALHGLYWLAVNLSSERPLLLAIDDLHWADRGSLRFVSYLMHRLEGLPLIVAATVRTGEAGTDEALLGDVSNDPG